MLSEKIKRIRDEMADQDARDYERINSHGYKCGFDAAWAIHEKLVAPLIEALGKYKLGDGCTAEVAVEKYKSEVGE